MDRFAAAVAAEIDQERSAGHLPKGLPSRDLATALVWSTERCPYIAGREAEATPLDERNRVEVLVMIWAGTVQLGRPQKKP